MVGTPRSRRPIPGRPGGQETLARRAARLNKDDVGALREASSVLDASPGTRDAFIRHVLTDFLGWKSNLAGAGHVPSTLTTPVPEYGTEVRPDFALLTDPDDPASAPLLLGIVVDPGVRATAASPTRNPRQRHMAGESRRPTRRTPCGRARSRSASSPTATEWTLVCASAGGATSTATWTRHAWLDEPDTLQGVRCTAGAGSGSSAFPTTRPCPRCSQAAWTARKRSPARCPSSPRPVVEMLVATIGRLDAEHRAQHGEPLLPATVGLPRCTRPPSPS